MSEKPGHGGMSDHGVRNPISGAGHPMVHIDPDLSIPTDTERGNSYLRALHILFPRAS